MEKQNKKSLINSTTPIIMVGGGWVHEDIFRLYADRYPIVALDGGADQVTALGYQPECVLGDLDSLKDLTCWSVPVHHMPDQNSTDFDKGLRSVNAPLIFAFGILGDRFDHALNCLHSLSKQTNGARVIAIGRDDAVRYCTQDIAFLSLPVATRVSIWCMQMVQFVASSGLTYPLDGLYLGAETMQGTSNSVSETQIVIQKSTESLGYYLMIPNECHQALINVKP